MLFGQHGNDALQGGDDDDLIVGDHALNVLPYWTDVPHISQGLRSIGNVDTSMGIQLEEFGSVISAPMTFMPEEVQMNDPFNVPLAAGHVIAETQSKLFEEAGLQHLLLSDGTTLRIYAEVVSDVTHHAGVLPGNDMISGNGGDDWIFADNATFYSPLVTGMKPIEDSSDAALDEWERVMNSFGVLTLDFSQHLAEVSGAEKRVGRTESPTM